MVWSGSSNDSLYNDLLQNSAGIQLRRGEQAFANEVQVRAGETHSYVEVKNRKINNWMTVAVPRQAGIWVIDIDQLLKRLINASSCDSVKTILDLSKSTPNASVHFNSKPVGEVKPDGRFYFESEGVCRNSKIEILASLQNCKDYSTSFKATNNPHTYKGRAKLDCTK